MPSPITNIAQSVAVGAQSGQLQERGMAYLVPIVASTAITFILDKYVFPNADEKEHQERLKFYDEIQEKVKKSKIHRFETTQSPKSGTGKIKRNSVTKTKKLIEESIAKLESAEEFTKCGECKKSIRDARKEIESKTDYILKAAETREVMQDMKKKGKLRSDAKWDNMEDGEKKIVKKYAKTSNV